MARTTKTKPSKSFSWEERITSPVIALVLAISTFILYWPVKEFEFTNWDDQVYVTGNNLILGLTGENIRRIFSEYLMGNYHPLVLLSYAIEYEIDGLNPGIFHVTNVLFHVGAGLILYFCFLEIGFNKLIGGILALLFLIHPFHVESVAWVSERKDVLYGFFWIAAWYAWLQSKSYDKWYVFAILLFILSCLSKGMAVTLPAILIATEWIKNKDISRINWVKLIPFFILTIGFGILAVYAQKGGGNVREDNTYGMWDQIRVAAWGIWFYLSRTLIPFDLSLFYEYPKIEKNGMPWQFTAAFVIIIISIPSFIFFVWKKSQVAVLGMVLFLAILFPVSQIFPVGNAIAADRYHYIPSIGLLILLGWIFTQVEKNKIFIGIVSIWIIGLVYISHQRIMMWKSPETLWNSTIERNPEIMFAYKNLAKYLEKKGKVDEAEQIYRNALQQDSSYAEGWNELGVILKNKGRNDEAYPLFVQSVKLDSINKEAWLNIGTWHDRKGETQEARIAYQKSLAIDSNYAEVWNNFANSLSRTQDYVLADIYFQKAITIYPGYAEAYNNRGTNFAIQGKYDSAQICLLQAMEVQSNYAEPAYNLAHVFLQQKKMQEGVEWMKKAADMGHAGAKQVLKDNGM